MINRQDRSLAEPAETNHMEEITNEGHPEGERKRLIDILGQTGLVTNLPLDCVLVIV